MLTPDALDQHTRSGVYTACSECAYNLVGLASDACPECGTPVDRCINHHVLYWNIFRRYVHGSIWTRISTPLWVVVNNRKALAICVPPEKRVAPLSIILPIATCGWCFVISISTVVLGALLGRALGLRAQLAPSVIGRYLVHHLFTASIGLVAFGLLSCFWALWTRHCIIRNSVPIRSFYIAIFSFAISKVAIQEFSYLLVTLIDAFTAVSVPNVWYVCGAFGYLFATWQVSIITRLYCKGVLVLMGILFSGLWVILDWGLYPIWYSAVERRILDLF